MSHVPSLWWPTALLALALLVDALLSIRPPAFIQGCLDGVGLPREWWWTLVVIKLLAAAGLVAGLVTGSVSRRTSGASPTSCAPSTPTYERGSSGRSSG